MHFVQWHDSVDKYDSNFKQMEIRSQVIPLIYSTLAKRLTLNVKSKQLSSEEQTFSLNCDSKIVHELWLTIYNRKERLLKYRSRIITWNAASLNLNLWKWNSKGQIKIKVTKARSTARIEKL